MSCWLLVMYTYNWGITYNSVLILSDYLYNFIFLFCLRYALIILVTYRTTTVRLFVAVFFIFLFFIIIIWLLFLNLFILFLLFLFYFFWFIIIFWGVGGWWYLLFCSVCVFSPYFLWGWIGISLWICPYFL